MSEFSDTLLVRVSHFLAIRFHNVVIFRIYYSTIDNR